MDPFRCSECGKVQVTIPHNDWGRTCLGVSESGPVVVMNEEVVSEVVGPVAIIGEPLSKPVEPIQKTEEPVLEVEEPVLPTFKSGIFGP